MGIAIAQIGMLYDDFMWLDFEEFDCVYESWVKAQEEARQEEWERVRTLAGCILAPYSRHNVNMKEVLPFPWDKTTTSNSEILSASDAKQRLEAVLARVHHSPK